MKNGFTLIELLAVIVILAIIALIATPIIINIINDVRAQSDMRSAELYLKAVELSIAKTNMSKGFNPTVCTVQGTGNLSCVGSEEEIVVEVENETATSGTITFENGKIVKVENLHIRNSYCNKEENSKLTCDGEVKEIGFTGTIYTDEIDKHILLGKSITPNVKAWCRIESDQKWCLASAEREGWCKVVPAHQGWCAIGEGYNSCTDEKWGYDTESDCLSDMWEGITSCKQETVPTYNSCTDDDYTLETRSQCLSEIEGWEGATCEQSGIIPEYNSCTDNNYKYNTKSDCLSDIENGVTNGWQEEGQYTCQKDETVEPNITYNSCTDDNLKFTSELECDSAAGASIYLGQTHSFDGTYCEQSDTIMAEGLTNYKTQFRDTETGAYLKHDVVDNIIVAFHACVKYESNGVLKESCIKGGDHSYYGTYDGISSTSIEDISDKNPTGNLAIINAFKNSPKDNPGEDVFCSFNISKAHCSNNNVGLDIFAEYEYTRSSEYYGRDLIMCIADKYESLCYWTD